MHSEAALKESGRSEIFPVLEQFFLSSFTGSGSVSIYKANRIHFISLLIRQASSAAMHHFISMMFSLLVITELEVSVVSAGRRPERRVVREYKSWVTVRNGGSWGSWGHREMCPVGTYAAGFSLKVEDHIGNGDDSALNGIRLHCINIFQGLTRSHDSYSSVRSEAGSWGWWRDIKWCPSGFLTAFQLRVEGPQGDGDDTAANNIKFKCSGGSVLVGDGTGWGDWGDWSNTCEGQGICGIQSKVEVPQGQGDDTALNDVRMFCCN